MLKPEDRDRVALFQGTLDLLILRILILDPQKGQGIARAIVEALIELCDVTAFSVSQIGIRMATVAYPGARSRVTWR